MLSKNYDEISQLINIGKKVKINGNYNICRGGLNGLHVGQVVTVSCVKKRHNFDRYRGYDWMINIKESNSQSFSYLECFDPYSESMSVNEDGTFEMKDII